MVSSAAQMFATNAQNHVTVNLPKRLLRWIAWKLQKELGFLENGDIWCLVRAIMDALPEDDVPEDALPEDALPEDNAPLPMPKDAPFELPKVNFLLALTPDQLDQLELRCRHIFLKAKNIILEGMSLGSVVSRSWWRYLRPLWRILRTFEKNSREDAQERIATHRRGRGLRTFSLLPITSYQQHFILIDTDALYSLCVQSGWTGLGTMADFRRDSKTWWERAFRIKKATTVNRRFGYNISTDGMSVSISVKRKAAEPDGINSHGFRDGLYIPLDVKGAHVIGLDPGRRDLFRTAHGEEKGEGESCSLKEWRSISRITQVVKKHQTWLDGNTNVKQIVQGKSSLYL